MNFLCLYIFQKLKTQFSQKYIFQNLHSSTDFDQPGRISTCILQTSHTLFQPNWCRQCWGMNFFVFISFKNFKHDFFNIHRSYAHFSGSIKQYALYSSGTCWYGCLLPNFVENSKFIVPTLVTFSWSASHMITNIDAY